MLSPYIRNKARSSRHVNHYKSFMKAKGVSHFAAIMDRWPESNLKTALANMVWWDAAGEFEPPPPQWQKYMDDTQAHNHVTNDQMVNGMVRLGIDRQQAVARICAAKKDYKRTRINEPVH